MPGEKFNVGLQYTRDDANAAYLSSAQIWGALDSNGNGVLGDDVPWDGNSAVTVGDAGLTIRLHEDTVTVAGVASISAEDWFF